jgi:uracil-DNA glycosylase family 4
MKQTVTFTRSQDKWASLNAHYSLFRTMFSSKFPESTFVPGDGNVLANVVFVGEAPGVDENAAGLPFVGKSGKYLNDLLKTVDIKRGDVFVTNFLHYRPPNNRDPKGDEVPVCSHLLRQELKILAPTIVVTLGRFSTSLFFEQPHMGTLAGQMWDRRGFTVIPMYHPAAAMYDNSGDIDNLMHMHIKTVGEVFHGLTRKPLVKNTLVKEAKPSLTKAVDTSGRQKTQTSSTSNPLQKTRPALSK